MRLSVAGVVALGVLQGCVAQSGSGSLKAVIDSRSDLSKFAGFVSRFPELSNRLSAGPPATIFAPSDAAWDALPTGVLMGLESKSNVLVRVLALHFVSGVSLSVAQLTAGGQRGLVDLVSDEGSGISATRDEVRDAGGAKRTWHDFGVLYGDNASSLWAASNLTATVSPIVRRTADMTAQSIAAKLVRDAVISSGDVQAANGVLHVVEAVMVPDSVPTRMLTPVPDLAPAVFRAALVPANLVEVLRSHPGPITILAPSDQAFATYGASGTLVFAGHDGLYQNATTLSALLQAHVVPGYFTAESFSMTGTVQTLNGASVSYNAGRLTDGNGGTGRLTTSNDTGLNGVVHVIDAVLRPAGLPTPDSSPTPVPEEYGELTQLDVFLVVSLALCLCAIGSYFLYTGSVSAYLKKRKRDTELDMRRIEGELMAHQEREKEEDYFLSLAERKGRSSQKSNTTAPIGDMTADATVAIPPRAHTQTWPSPRGERADWDGGVEGDVTRTPQTAPADPHSSGELHDLMRVQHEIAVALDTRGAEDNGSCSSFSSPPAPFGDRRASKGHDGPAEFLDAGRRIQVPPPPDTPPRRRRHSAQPATPEGTPNWGPVASPQLPPQARVHRAWPRPHTRRSGPVAFDGRPFFPGGGTSPTVLRLEQGAVGRGYRDSPRRYTQVSAARAPRAVSSELSYSGIGGGGAGASVMAGLSTTSSVPRSPLNVVSAGRGGRRSPVQVGPPTVC